MIHNIWKKLTEQEHLYRMERSLQKKMLKCENEEQWEKLNQRRKKIRRQRHRIQTRCRMMAVAGIILLTAGTVKLGMEAFTGDCILGTDEFFAWDTGLPAYYNLYGPEYFLKNVRSIFEEDDLTVVNMEGTLTEETTRVDKQFAFKGDPEYVKILTSSSVEAANIANNHSHDYGEKSFQDTVQTLEENGIKTFGYDDVAVLEVKGIRVGMFGIYELDDHLERIPQVKQDIAKLKDQNVDIIVAVFHWSNELVTVPDENQVTLAYLAIDEGADVVVGHHPHVVQGIDEYKGKMIAYSLGNFCFGGNTHPTEMDTFIFQQKFILDGKRNITGSEYKVIPCRVSSETTYNNYQPTPLVGEEAKETMDKIEERSQEINNG